MGAMADELQQERVEEAREILAALGSRLPTVAPPEAGVAGYERFWEWVSVSRATNADSFLDRYRAIG